MIRNPLSAGRNRAALCFVLFLFQASPTARPQAQPALPPDLAEFAAQAQAALKSGDNETLQRLAATPDTLRRLGPRNRREADWKIAVLPLPEQRRGGDRETRRQGVEENKDSRLTPHPSSLIPHPYLVVFYDFHTCQSVNDQVHRLVKTAQGWRIGPEIPETDTRGYRVRDHRLDVRFDLPQGECRITDAVKIERISTADVGTQEPCLLRLSSVLHVESVTSNGRPYPFRHVPGLIAVLPPAEPTFTLTLTYRGRFNEPRMDSYIRKTEVYLNTYWYPHIARLPAKHGVTVTVPKGWTAVGEGDLLKRSDGPKETTFTYRNEIPVCWFSLACGPYTITTRTVDGRKLSVCELQPVQGRAERVLDRLTRSLAFFETRFGKFPYTQYAAVETLGPFGGALEAYSFSTYGRGAFGAVVHEVAHTWWGGIVPNPYTRSQWNEAFADYSEGLYNRLTGAEKPARAARSLRGRNLAQVYAVPIAEAFDTDKGSHNAVGYGKGSQVLAMLEDLLGTETMLRALRRFVDDHTPGEAADWPDFRRAVEKTTGKDYGWFFEQWIERGGVPQIRPANVRQTQENGLYVVTAEIVQEGKPYRLPRFPVALEGEGGPLIEQEVEVSGPTTAIRLTSRKPPTTLRLDPDGNILLQGTEDFKFSISANEQRGRSPDAKGSLDRRRAGPAPTRSLYTSR